MMPSSPRRPLVLLVAASLAFSLAGCDKPAPEDALPPLAKTETTKLPSPSPTPDRTGRKALSAYNAVSEYLKDQDPDLGEKLQTAATRFVRDKDKWRGRLKDRQRELQPRIARARDQITKAQGKSVDALHNLQKELATLESQRNDAERKLAELESITSDTWKSFRDRLNLGDDPAPSPVSNDR